MVLMILKRPIQTIHSHAISADIASKFDATSRMQMTDGASPGSISHLQIQI